MVALFCFIFYCRLLYFYRMKATFLYLLLLLAMSSSAQQKETFTHADTLRGSLNPNRMWWDVLRYDISVTPDYEAKTIEGSNIITYKQCFNSKLKTDQIRKTNIVLKKEALQMQIDLQQPMIIDSIVTADSIIAGTYEGRKKDEYRGANRIKLNYKTEGNVTLVNIPENHFDYAQDAITIYYHGKPREAVKPPWDGGWIWSKDSLGRPWMSVACQGLGASVWYPCKDHQSDEPDSGASLTITVADSLVAVGNGRLTNKHQNGNGTTSYTWRVVNPINNYLIVPYIGKYVNFGEVYKGEKGNLDVNFWVLDYNAQRAKEHSLPEVNRMLKAFEYWMGPYPFYEDSYKLVDAPHLGMEHQSATAYGNKYMNGYLGRDLSGTGWGLKWDFIIVHESGHEWFANNITSKDLADMWIHEGFTNYSETLFTDYYYGSEAGNEYNFGIRKRIQNDKPIIAHYGVNEEGSGDMYYKSGNMLHAIRHSLNDDEKFRMILRGLNKTFYHQTVTTAQIENYVDEQAHFDYSKVFDQYLTTTQIPSFEYYFTKEKNKVFYRYTNCIAGFNLPLTLKDSSTTMIKIYPTTEWKSSAVTGKQASLFTKDAIEKMYDLNVK